MCDFFVFVSDFQAFLSYFDIDIDKIQRIMFETMIGQSLIVSTLVGKTVPSSPHLFTRKYCCKILYNLPKWYAIERRRNRVPPSCSSNGTTQQNWVLSSNNDMHTGFLEKLRQFFVRHVLE